MAKIPCEYSGGNELKFVHLSKANIQLTQNVEASVDYTSEIATAETDNTGYHFICLIPNGVYRSGGTGSPLYCGRIPTNRKTVAYTVNMTGTYYTFAIAILEKD